MSQAAIFSVPTVGPASPTTMAARIDDNFKAAVSGHSGSSRPAYAVDGSFWVSTATAGQRKLYFYDGSDDNLVLTLDIATGKITYSDGTNADAIAAALTNPVLKWRSRAIGEVIMLNTGLTGVDIPPSTTSDTIWIELTSGLTGVGAFNNGKLTTESVSGSAPLVAATAVINYASSPMLGQTIHLLNTESRIERPSTSPNNTQNDAVQNISGTFDLRRTNAGGGGEMVTNYGGAMFDSGANGQATPVAVSGADIAMRTIGFNAALVARTATETRMKNLSVKAYMRIA
ncbi:hypothetical protein M2311_003656 [Rhizobium leguminosarum]|uniref:hypothetical protein n=1 Tax=Rhizobium leguminosarum TaxID=384 RepID=UPI001FEE3138|nr:hypothetical protein [Rhizobium leguminosarum]MDH6273566.1 hypothetical protein [Rhizobium leguminosarum]